jgi:hypothetical protein
VVSQRGGRKPAAPSGRLLLRMEPEWHAVPLTTFAATNFFKALHRQDKVSGVPVVQLPRESERELPISGSQRVGRKAGEAGSAVQGSQKLKVRSETLGLKQVAAMSSLPPLRVPAGTGHANDGRRQVCLLGRARAMV